MTILNRLRGYRAHLFGHSLIGIGLLLVLAGGGKAPVAFYAASTVLCVSVLVASRAPWGWNRLSSHPASPALLGFLLWGIASTFHSPAPMQSFPHLFKFLVYALFGAACLLWEEPHKRLFLHLSVLGAAVQSVLIITELFGVHPFLFLVGNRNYTALFLVSVSLILLARTLDDPSPRRLLPGSGVILLSAAVFLLSSRIATLSWMAGTGFLLIRRYSVRGTIVVLSSLAVALFITDPVAIEQFLKWQDPFAFSRLSIWRSALLGILQKPLLGWGPGQFPSLYQTHALPIRNSPVLYGHTTPFAHNEFLQLAAEYGIPATVFLVWGILRTFRRYHRAALPPSFWAVSLTFLLFSLCDFPFYLPFNGLWMMAFMTAGGPTLPVENPGRMNPGVRLALAGLALFSLTRWGSASLERLGHPEASLTINPWNISLRRQLADDILHKTAGPVDRARGLLEKALRLSPRDAESWHDLSHLYLVHERPPQRESGLEARRFAGLYYPTYAPWYLETAKILADAGSLESAKAHVKKAIQYEPNYWSAHLELGILFRREGNPEKAVRWFEHLRTEHQRSTGRMETSRDLYSGIILAFPSDELFLETARAWMDLGRHDVALGAAERANPDNPSVLLTLAEIHFRRKDYRTALHILEELKKKDPKNPALDNNIDLVRRKVGRS
ncbi:MAG TPA: tetratricopeptide repeat protein [Elusimicrobiota bacterium]|nr:tetratricopeptide repeat protein [Elusimicrobiota bacterium]